MHVFSSVASGARSFRFLITALAQPASGVRSAKPLPGGRRPPSRGRGWGWGPFLALVYGLLQAGAWGPAGALPGRRAPARPQAATIEGRVSDASNLSSLAGVEVALAEMDVRAVTQRDGSYRLGGLPAGEYTVSFTYLSYQSVSRKVSVAAGGTADLDVVLGGEVLQLQTFRVEGVREGQARALNQQKNAVNLRNIVSADAMGNFPDHNVAESLQRIPGVYTESNLGEPKFVSIRGAAPYQNGITMDGISVLSAEQDIRTVALDVYPTAQISGIEVVKAVTPDMDGDSIGGAIVLKGKSAFDANRRIASASVSTNYNDLVEGFGHRAAVSYGDVFGAKRDWGAQFSYTHENYKSWEQSNETNGWIAITTAGRAGFVPTTLLQSSVFVDKKRTSLSGALEKKLGDAATVYVKAFENHFDDDHARDGLRYELGVNATGGGLDLTQPIDVADDGTFIRYTTTGTTMRRQTQPQAFRNKATGLIGGLKIEHATWGGEVAAALNRTSSDFWTTQAQWVSRSAANRANIDQSDRDFWRVNQLTGTPYFDPAGLRFNQVNERKQLITNKEQLLKGDAYKIFNVADSQLKLSAGAKSRWGVKKRDNNVAVWNGLIAGQTLDFNDLRLGGNVAIDPEWLGGRYDFGPAVDAWKYAEFFSANHSTFDPVAVQFTDTKGIFTPNLNNSYNNSLQNDYSAVENIHAGYVKGEWTRGKFSLIAGVRYELTDMELKGTKIDATKPNSDRSRYQLYRDSGDYGNVLPAVHVRYEVTPRFVLRGAWTNTIARPLVNDLVSSFAVNSINLTINGGNPNLKATESMNWDFTAEYYLSSVGVVSAGVFAKQLKGPIYASTVPLVYDDGTGPKTYQYTTSTNAGDADLMGFEASYQQQLRFLPSPFDGLGVYANVTLVNSNVDIPQRPNEKFTLFSQADSLGNLALFYQKYGVSARLAYTFRSPYLSVLLTPGTDTYYDSEQRLDFQLSYKINRHWSVMFGANNLLNTPERLYHGTVQRQEFYGLTGRIYSVGLSWEL